MSSLPPCPSGTSGSRFRRTTGPGEGLLGMSCSDHAGEAGACVGPFAIAGGQSHRPLRKSGVADQRGHRRGTRPCRPARRGWPGRRALACAGRPPAPAGRDRGQVECPGGRLDAHRPPRGRRQARQASPGSWLSFVAHPDLPEPFTDGRARRICACHGRSWSVVNAGQHCWNACCCRAPFVEHHQPLIKTFPAASRPVPMRVWNGLLRARFRWSAPDEATPSQTAPGHSIARGPGTDGRRDLRIFSGVLEKEHTARPVNIRDTRCRPPSAPT